MNSDLGKRANQLQIGGAEIERKRQQVYQEVLSSSSSIDQGNFTRIHDNDLNRLFELYDAKFFAGDLTKNLGNSVMDFRFSNRMTSAGGKLTQRKSRSATNGAFQFELRVSSYLLFQSYRHIDRPISVNGLVCKDRLQALLSIFEHELIHLLEILAWGKSSCSGKRFQELARNLFGHQQFTHQLITQDERAQKQFDIRPGCLVSFSYEGKDYVGKVNRITKRVTVLVEDEKGLLYTDGKRYAKFYVPLNLLKKAE